PSPSSSCWPPWSASARSWCWSRPSSSGGEWLVHPSSVRGRGVMKRLTRWLLPVLATGMLGLAIYHVVGAAQVLPPPAPPPEPPRTAFTHTVGGAGIVEAWTENISIGTPLPGVVLEVYVPVEKVGQTVKKGDPLFLVDNRQLLATLRYNEANLRAARAQL